jgi:hypothetical protein
MKQAGSASSVGSPGWEGNDGFTLIEVIVVLMVMMIAVSVVAPAFLPPKPHDSNALDEPLRITRRLALTRGESVYLDFTATGEWTVRGASSLAEGPLARGRVESYAGPGGTVVASPLGTCAYDLHTAAVGAPVPIDPLSCTTEPQ